MTKTPKPKTLAKIDPIPEAQLKEFKSRTKKILKVLKDRYGNVKTFLRHKNAFELLCAVSLSAQCTDDRVNITTPHLFKKFPTPEKMARAKQEDVEKLIKSCGFYKNKARNLIAMSQRLVEVYNSEVPDTIEDLTTLGGVGRKTANVVLGAWFNKPEGVVVDTHVLRITKLLGLNNHKDAVKAEACLNQMVPQKERDQFTLLLISHGRETCIARRPQCDKCSINKYCNFFTKQ